MTLRALALVAALACPAVAVAAPPRASLPDIEDEVMCPVCGVPLNLADAPQADRQREFIRALIARGYTKAEIKRELQAEFGPTVLAVPRDSGFDLAAYVVPAIVGLLAVGGLGVAVVRWRRRADAAGGPVTPTLTTAQARRLEDDLARYDG
jgi:cytochrome c-type biogenesis protein CcmH